MTSLKRNNKVFSWALRRHKRRWLRRTTLERAGERNATAHLRRGVLQKRSASIDVILPAGTVWVFLLQMKKRNTVTVGTSQLADMGVFFVEDGFRPPALRKLS